MRWTPTKATYSSFKLPAAYTGTGFRGVSGVILERETDGTWWLTANGEQYKMGPRAEFGHAEKKLREISEKV